MFVSTENSPSISTYRFESTILLLCSTSDDESNHIGTEQCFDSKRDSCFSSRSYWIPAGRVLFILMLKWCLFYALNLWRYISLNHCIEFAWFFVAHWKLFIFSVDLFPQWSWLALMTVEWLKRFQIEYEYAFITSNVQNINKWFRKRIHIWVLYCTWSVFQ